MDRSYGWSPEQMARINARREARGQDPYIDRRMREDEGYRSEYTTAGEDYAKRQESLASKKLERESADAAEKQAFWNQSFAGQKELARTQESQPSSFDLKVPEVKFNNSYIPGQYSSPSNNPSLLGTPKVNPSSQIVGGPEVKPNLASKQVSPIKMFPWDTDSKGSSVVDYSNQYYKKMGSPDSKLTSNQVAPIKMFPDSLPSAPKESPLTALSPIKMKKNYN